MNKKILLLITTLAFSIITGCTSVVSTTTNKPIQDDLGQRTWGAKIDDSLIETKIAVNIKKADIRLDDNSRVVVVSYNGVVLLAGQVPSKELKSLASKAAANSRIQGIKQVHNDLQITPIISFATRSGDAWITSKIKSAMAFDAKVPATRVKVVTENGIAYLFGLLTRKEAKATVAATRTVDGVKRIVMLFEYID